MYIHLNGILGISNNRKVYQCSKETELNSLDHMHTDPGLASHFIMKKTTPGLKVHCMRTKFSTSAPATVFCILYCIQIL